MTQREKREESAIETQWEQWNRLEIDTQIVNSVGVKIRAAELLRIKRKPISEKKSIMRNKATSTKVEDRRSKITRKIKICLVTHWNLASQERKVNQRMGL